MWFEKLFGFIETEPEDVRAKIICKNGQLTSLVNGNSYQYGALSIPTLEELKREVGRHTETPKRLQFSEIVADVQDLHCLKENNGALFQAASQFNLLEMVNPDVTPERGVGIYEFDHTQGPACAIACGAGTVYRNYFVPIGNQIGQSASLQVDCLSGIGEKLNNEALQLWTIKNGYAFLSQAALVHISQHIENLSQVAYTELRSLLKVGIQWDTEVTIGESGQLVTQVYSSAFPVAYSEVAASYWEAFARLILEGTYEATLYAAVLNRRKTGNNKVYLTMVGGGVFGNKTEWITEAIIHALNAFKEEDLDVKMVSYGASSEAVRGLVESWF